MEFWSLPAAAGVEVKDFIRFFRDPPEGASLKMLSWNDRELGGSGFSPWTPTDHPQLGRVEVGGWKTKFTHQNPPPKFLEGECEKLARFAMTHASTAPRLAAELRTEQLGPDVRRLELRVENTGYLPTNVTRIAADKKLVKPVKATLASARRGGARLRRTRNGLSATSPAAPPSWAAAGRARRSSGAYRPTTPRGASGSCAGKGL